MNRESKYCIRNSLFVIVLFLSVTGHSQNNTGYNKEGLKQSCGFIENKGQIIDQNNKPNPAVLYLLNTPGMNVQLRRGGFSYDLYRISNIEQRRMNNEVALDPSSVTRHASRVTPSSMDTSRAIYNFHRIDIDLQNANANPTVETSSPSTDYLNYYTSGTPAEGVTSVKSFGGITYKNVYPGIDLQFITNSDGNFEYNFLLQPGADIASIQLKVAGPERIKSFKEKIQMVTSVGDIDETIPLCYYSLNNIQVPVKGRFKKIKDQLYGFSVDHIIPDGAVLLIDPIPTRRWGTYLGGGSHEYPYVNTCKTDNTGNCIIGGYTNSSNNIASSGAHQVVFGGIQDGFLAKFLPDGQQSWCTYYGGSNGDNIQAVAIDNLDNIFIGGNTQSSSNIATTGAFKTTLTGGSDAFFAKFTNAGIRQWGTYYGGSSGEWAYGCAADNLGNIYYAGITWSPDGIATAGAVQATFGGGDNDGFLTKFTGNGGIVWGTYYGGNNNEQDFSCTTDGDNHVFMTGSTLSPNNIATPGSFKPIKSDLEDAFLACFYLNGQRKWGTYFGGSSFESIGGVSANSNDEIYICGTTWSPDNIGTSGTFQPNKLGFGGAFLAKFDTNCQRLWGSYYGSIGENGYGCAVDDSGYVFMVGTANGMDPVIVSPGAYQSAFSGINDGYFVKFDWNGQRIWGTYFGSTGQDEALNIATDHDDNIYITGWTNSTSLIATPGAFQQGMGGIFDVFLEKFADCYSPDTAIQINGPVEVCTNSSVIYSIAPITGAASYHWYTSSNLTILSGQNSTSITVSAGSVAGTDTVSVYGKNSCDNGFPKSMLVNTIPRPVPTLTGNTSVCQGESITYSTDTGKTSYVWDISSGGTKTGGGTSLHDFVSITWNTPGLQWVSVNYTENNGCTAGTATLLNADIAAGLPVNVAITASQTQVCSGTSVIFTAIPTNPGTTPSYQWKVNGVNAGTNNPIFTFPPVNGDVVICILTSSILVCIANNPATSNSITMVVNPNLPVINSISPSVNPACAGTSVTFTAIPTHGGITPVYQWKVNGTNFGANSPTYSYIPATSDVITCVLTSSETCTTGNPAISNPITMTVNPNLLVNVSIISSSNPFCAGSSVTFTATPNNGGTTPIYQWKVNANNVINANNAVFSYVPVDGDVVTCSLLSSEICESGNPGMSNAIAMVVNANMPAGITIVASSNPFCPGTTVTFTAIPGNGGSSPTYQWMVNGTNAGTNSPVFAYTPANNDSVRCVMTSNLNCVTSNPAISGAIIMIGSLAPNVTFTTCFDTITTIGAKPLKLKGGIPLGGTFSGPGVNPATGVFTPSTAGTGLKTILYTYTNVLSCSANMSKTILVQPNPAFICGNNFTDIRDNKIYPTVQIGAQCWMQTNLDFGITIDDFTQQTDNCISERYLSLVNSHLSFYQWDELMRYTSTPASQGICPPGWHVPTSAEWDQLLSYYNGPGLAGGTMKDDLLPNGFQSHQTGLLYLNNTWAFTTGLAAGVMYWTSTSSGADRAVARGLNEYNMSVSKYEGARGNGFAARCLKD